MGLSTVNRFLTKMAFKTMLIKQRVYQAEFEHMLAQTNFTRVDIDEDEMGFEITMTK